MTSELRPAAWMYRRMTTAEDDRVEFTRTPWAYVLTGYTETPLYTLEAVRAEQAAELAEWRDKYNALGQCALEQVSDLGTKLGRTEVELGAAMADLQAANRELAKWKALAETLAGALERIALGVSIELDDEDGPVEVWMDEEEMSEIARQALTSYKEQRDAISN